MAKIDRVEDLPEWFDPEKYKGCESFGVVEWLEQVGRRYDLLEYHPSRVGLTRPEASDTWNAFVMDYWKIAMREGAQQVREYPMDSSSKGKIGEWMASPDNQPIKAVRALDLLWQVSRDRDAERDGKAPLGISERWSAIIPDKISALSFAKWAEAPLTINQYKGTPESHIVQIDLGASDPVLITAFAEWLKAARAQQPARASKRERPAYKDWARYGLLPYLDLLIWTMETGNQIPHHVMAEAVGYRKGGDSFRKTVPKLAAELMHSLAELAALAAIEATPEKLGA